jgi:hypothetical protein
MSEYLNIRQKPLHLRRTLDQYCYYALRDTIYKDTSQLLQRLYWPKFENQKPTLMVDQLWLWKTGEGRSKVATTIAIRLVSNAIQVILLMILQMLSSQAFQKDGAIRKAQTIPNLRG